MYCFSHGRRAFIDQMDLVRIMKLNTLSVDVVDESQWSWQLRAGMDRVNRQDEGRYDGVGSFGLGRAKKLNEEVIVYGMVDMAGHTLSPYARLRPYAGLRFDFGKTRAWMFGGVESTDYKGGFNDVWGGKIQYQCSKNTAIYLGSSNEKAARATLGLDWYW